MASPYTHLSQKWFFPFSPDVPLQEKQNPKTTPSKCWESCSSNEESGDQIEPVFSLRSTSNSLYRRFWRILILQWSEHLDTLRLAPCHFALIKVSSCAVDAEPLGP